ncbi:MAG: MoxR family ATPase [Polyangiaceae bacterium]
MATLTTPPWIPTLAERLAAVIRGKPEVIELLLIGALTAGHVLVEDVPGVGKTTLAKALARTMDLAFARIQFTPDLLPSDILGTHVLDPREGTMRFQEGPLFTNVLLADEINRASPRTQAALLEAMNEGQVTIDGKTMALPEPFLVLATQNPIDFQGTYPLPEAQLDRFVLRIKVGYPALEDEVKMLFDRKTVDPLADVPRVVGKDELVAAQALVRDVDVKPAVGKYIAEIVAKTRAKDDVALGASPRASLWLFRAAQARALLRGRAFVTPDDVQSLVVHVLAHRIQMSERARYGGKSAATAVSDLAMEVPVPT